MSEAHHRITRHELREPDEFMAFTGQVMDWVRQNQSAVIGAVSTVIAVGAVALGMNWYAGRQADAAAVKLEAAQATFEAKAYANAAIAFADTASAYPGTSAGRIALLYRAHALAQQPDPAAAATAYSEYLATTPATDYLRQAALIGLAQSNEASGNAAAATTSYRQAAATAGPFRLTAQVALARLEDAAGHAEQAQALYAEIATSPDLDADTRQALASKLPPRAVDAPADAK